MSKEIATIDPNGSIPNPSEDLTVVVEPSEGFKGGRMNFDMPFEPISSYVGQVVMWNSHVDGIISYVTDKAPFDVTAWNPKTRELRVKLHKGAFGIK